MAEIVRRALKRSVHARTESIQDMVELNCDKPTLRDYSKAAIFKSFGRIFSDLVVGDFMKDPSYIGLGWEQVVFGSERTIEKLVFATAGLSEERATKAAVTYQAAFDTAKEDLGDYWVDTAFAARPLNSPLGRYAVVATQPKLDIAAVFPGVAEMMQHRSDQPYLDQQRDLLARIRRLYQRTDILPDLIGPGNLVAALDDEGQENIRIVDTIPHTPQKLALPTGFRDGDHRQLHMMVIGTWLKYLDQPQSFELLAA